MRWKGGDLLGMPHAEISRERMQTGFSVSTFTVTPRKTQRRATRKKTKGKRAGGITFSRGNRGLSDL
jgi:hypothetical protein